MTSRRARALLLLDLAGVSTIAATAAALHRRPDPEPASRTVRENASRAGREPTAHAGRELATRTRSESSLVGASARVGFFTWALAVVAFARRGGGGARGLLWAGLAINTAGSLAIADAAEGRRRARGIALALAVGGGLLSAGYLHLAPGPRPQGGWGRRPARTQGDDGREPPGRTRVEDGLALGGARPRWGGRAPVGRPAVGRRR
ncbi:hypothetical protein ACEXQD_08415 [Herbiconiux sp. P15]|uniref:hypothetical protein n=1 Tax=Herbiconiux liukaitaii TaxID=3342799 RepID=UPI0035BAB479